MKNKLDFAATKKAFKVVDIPFTGKKTKDMAEYYFHIQMISLFRGNSAVHKRISNRLDDLNKYELINSEKYESLKNVLNVKTATIVERNSLDVQGLSLLPAHVYKRYSKEIDEIKKILNSKSFPSLAIPYENLVSDQKAPVKSLDTIPQLFGLGKERVKAKINHKYTAITRPWIETKVSSEAILFLMELGVLKTDNTHRRNVSLTQLGEESAAVIIYSYLHPEKLEFIGMLAYYMLYYFCRTTPAIYSILRAVYNKPQDIIAINNQMAGAGDNLIPYVNQRMAYVEHYMKRIENEDYCELTLPDNGEYPTTFIKKYVYVLEDQGYLKKIEEDETVTYFGEELTVPVTKYEITDRGREVYDNRANSIQTVYSVFFNSQPGSTIEKFLTRRRFEVMNILINEPITLAALRDKMLVLGYWSLQQTYFDIIKDILALGYNIKASRDGEEIDLYDELYNRKVLNHSKFDDYINNVVFWIENTTIDREYVNHFALPQPHAVAAKENFQNNLIKLNHLFTQVYLFDHKAQKYKPLRLEFIRNIKYAIVHACQKMGITAECTYDPEEFCAYGEFLGWYGYIDFSNYFTEGINFDYDVFSKSIHSSSRFNIWQKKCKENTEDKKPCILFVTKYAEEYFEAIIPKIKEEYNCAVFAISYDTLMIHMERYIDIHGTFNGSAFHEILNSMT